MKTVSHHSKRTLGPEASTALRAQLATEPTDVNSAEDAANRAHRALGANSSFTATATTSIEEVSARSFTTDTTDGSEMSQETGPPHRQRRSHPSKRQRFTAIEFLRGSMSIVVQSLEPFASY